MTDYAGERLAKRIAAAGICSRRDAEKLITAGRVSVDGERVTTPAFNVTESQTVTVDGEKLPQAGKARLWIYHKPPGLVTTHKDERGRMSVFDALPKTLPRVVSVGRLDLNSEGLLLLTTDGGLARQLERSDLPRRYRVRVFGSVTPEMIENMGKGLTIEGIRYAPVKATIDSGKGDNIWLTVTLTEGKNREIRNIFEHFGCKVNRLIRVSYGPYELGELGKGEVREAKIL